MRILRENFASLIVWLTAFEKVRAVHGKPRWDIAMIFLCEKDWLNALMAPPVTCRIKRRRLRWLRTEPLSVMLQALGEVAIDGIQSQN